VYVLIKNLKGKGVEMVRREEEERGGEWLPLPFFECFKN
jgi:hypothetical protein